MDVGSWLVWVVAVAVYAFGVISLAAYGILPEMVAFWLYVFGSVPFVVLAVSLENKEVV